MINIGIIGTGFGSKVHVPGFRNIPNVQVYGITGDSFSKTKKIAKQLNIPNTYSSWQELINDEKIDAISIATPPHIHKDIVTSALKNSKAILCEKPFGKTLQDAQAMTKSVKKQKMANAVDFEFRYVPEFQYLKTLLDKKLIGDIRYVSINWITGGRASINAKINWSNYKKYGGGILANYGSHVIDYIEWLINPIQKVNANLSIVKQSKKNIDAEDTCEIKAILKNNVKASVLITNVVFGGEGHTIEIFGSKGTLKLSNPNLFDFMQGFSIVHINGKTEKEKKLITPKKFGTISSKVKDGHFQSLIKLLKSNQKLVAVGECGFDLYYGFSAEETQTE